MTRDVGDRLLQITGKAATARGIFQASEIQRAMQALESAVLDESAHPTPIQIDLGHADQSPEDANVVTLRQQVWPLVEMMKRAMAEDRSIVWGV